jgi:hypothetical protein
MLIIKCAKCNAKILKYKKIGSGKVLRCYKERISRFYEGRVDEGKLKCGNCENVIGVFKENYIDMNNEAFTYSGTRDKK